MRSMRAAFEEIGVDRNTVARTAIVAELSIAAPEAYDAVGQWDEKAETLTAYVQKCRSAITPEIRARINELKDGGKLLPISV